MADTRHCHQDARHPVEDGAPAVAFEDAAQSVFDAPAEEPDFRDPRCTQIKLRGTLAPAGLDDLTKAGPLTSGSAGPRAKGRGAWSDPGASGSLERCAAYAAMDLAPREAGAHLLDRLMRRRRMPGPLRTRQSLEAGVHLVR